MTTVLTQKERLAALEAESEAHAREHELTERVWSAKLDAIDARTAGHRALPARHSPPTTPTRTRAGASTAATS